MDPFYATEMHFAIKHVGMQQRDWLSFSPGRPTDHLSHQKASHLLITKRVCLLLSNKKCRVNDHSEVRISVEVWNTGSYEREKYENMHVLCNSCVSSWTLMHSGYLCKCPHAPVAMCSALSFGCLGNLPWKKIVLQKSALQKILKCCHSWWELLLAAVLETIFSEELC